MKSLLAASLCLALAGARVVHAQDAQPPGAAAVPSREDAAVDAALARAQRLVGNGQGSAGRELVDSVLAATPVTSPRFPEILFTRASLSATAVQAERDYRRLFVEFPISPRAADALLRLAQLEIARGDRALARKHLERLAREHPGSPALPRANYWLARVRFESGDTRNGCAALDAARAASGPGDVELRNQIDYYASRCGGLSSATPTAPATVAATPAATAAPVTGAPPSPGAAVPAARSAPTAPAGPTVSAPPTAAPVATAAVPAVEAPEPSGAAASPSAPAARSVFSVQVAAYNTRAPAEQLAAKLYRRGVAARVDGQSAPYRVRVGRYRTHAEAADAAERLRAQRISGIVVESEPR